MLHQFPNIKAAFPNLDANNHIVTSPEDLNYNCIAWAVGENDVWWWPDLMLTRYWPEEIPRQETIDAFVQAFSLKGYSQCNDSGLEQGYEKIALFAINQTPTHASRQLPSGHWTSKLGESFDISHQIDTLNGSPIYGSIALYFRREITL